MELTVAGEIAVKQITGGIVDKKINEWLTYNADVEIIDIKFATSATSEDWSTDALIIFRRE